jgi:dGTPase
VLDECVKSKGLVEGFEGNAQSFRIVNTLSKYAPEYNGINLTYATNNAILKYPWLYNANPQKNKYGVYKSEESIFNNVRNCDHVKHLRPTIRTLEASIMDIADDITYAVHDFEDFFRANLIPWENKFEILIRDRLDQDPKLMSSIGGRDPSPLKQEIVMAEIKSGQEDWFPVFDDNTIQNEIDSFIKFLDIQPLRTPFKGTMRERAYLREYTSAMIKRFIYSIKINKYCDDAISPISLGLHEAIEIIVFKFLHRFFIINHPGLKRQQHGEDQIIQALFGILFTIALEQVINSNDDIKPFFDISVYKSNDLRISPIKNALGIFPKIYQERLISTEFMKISQSLYPNPDITVSIKSHIARIVADAISLLTDDEAGKMHQKLTGINLGTFTDNVAFI